MPMGRHSFGGVSHVEMCAFLLCSWVHFGGYCVTWNLLRGASGGLEGSLEGRTGVFIASCNLFGCFQNVFGISWSFFGSSYTKRVGLVTV